MSTSKTPALNEQIVKTVESYWEANKRPMMLAALGTEGDPPITELVRGEDNHPSLRKYLQMELAGQVQVIQDKNNPLVHGAVPASVPVEKIDAEFALKKSPQLKKYHSVIWAAFSKPLSTTKQRYVNTKGNLRFEDVESDSDLQKSDSYRYIQVMENEIVLTGDKQLIEENINNWITKHELEASHFFVTTSARRSNSILSQLIASLEPHDLRRVTMPLDVVAKLSRR